MENFTPPDQCLVVFVDRYAYGLALPTVDRVLRLVEITPLPRAPAVVCGVVVIEGAVLPVIELRRRFGLPEREPELSDVLVLVRTPRRRLAVLVDAVNGVERVEREEWVPVSTVVGGVDHIEGMVKRRDGLILIHDLEACLSIEEERVLQTALSEGVNTG
jgi:purine-binding chemotaxis protein CheW